MRKEVTFLVAAAVLHMGIPLGARFIHPRAIAPAALKLHPMEVVVEIPVEPLQEPPAARIEPRAPSNEAPSPAPEPRVAAAVTPRDPDTHVEAPTAPEPGATAAPAAPTGGPAGRAPDNYDTLPEGPGDGIARAPGIGAPIWTLPGAMPVAPRAAPAPTVATGPRPVDKNIAGIVIADAMIENDKRLGLDLPGSGTVASAVRAAVVSSDTPSEGRASFEVRVGPDGRVLSVRVASSSGGTSDVWDRAAKAVLAQMAGKPLQMNSRYAKGAIISISVSSTMALPSGAKSGVTQQGSGIGFDVSDIGAHKSRSVKTSHSTAAIC